jgi:Neuraminidase (sialidase)
VNLLRKTFWLAPLAAGALAITSTLGLAGVTAPVRASALTSPYAACASQDAAQIAATGGRNYLNAEVEPTVSVFGDNVIGMWHEDRWSNGGAHGIGLGTSSNGGVNWSNGTMPWDACAPGTPLSLAIYLRNSDPWVSFGPDGTAYASALSFNLGYPNNYNAVAAATSSDFGATWQNAQPIPGSAFTTFSQSTDKNSTTADPIHAGVAYTVWDTLIEPTDNPDDNPHTAAYTGPAYFSKTTDGGVTWSQAKIIVNTKNRSQTIGNIIVVDPRDDALYNFFDLLLSPNTPFQGTRSNAQVAFIKSTDGGDHWTQPQIIAPFNSLGVQDPNTGEPLRVGDGLEEVAIDPANGNLYVVWERSSKYQKQLKQSSGAWDDQIVLSRSTDGGQTWLGPTVIHTAGGLPTFIPQVAVNSGVVAVTYYDNRNLTASQTQNLPTDYFIEYSTDNGATFHGETRITTTSFDARTAPVARGFFLGDYEGLVPMGSNSFGVLFVKTNCDSTDAAGQVFPAGGPCAPASSTSATTSNTNPTDAFFSKATP